MSKLTNEHTECTFAKKEKRRLKEKDKIVRVLADLQENHNHTWYKELYDRNGSWLNDIALFYRGNNISYKKMFDEMQTYAKSLRMLGLHEGCEVPICFSNMPELIYLLGAISIIGAKANIFGTDFEHDYILEIINSCDNNVLFIVDNAYVLLRDTINASKVKRIVLASLIDSLPKGKNPYEEYDKKHGQIQDMRSQYLGKDNRMITISEFASLGTTYIGDFFSESGLDDEFIITYTSGSTNTTRPKAIVHTTRSLITIWKVS